MVANEVYYSEGLIDQNNKIDHPWHAYSSYDVDDDYEETLSLCDLPIYSSSASFESTDGNSNLSRDDYLSESYDHQDFFEFISGELEDGDSNFVSAEDIIFCGKLIPYQIPPVISHETKHKRNQIHKENLQQESTVTKQSFLQWRSKSMKSSKNNTNGSSKSKNRYYTHNELLGPKTFGTTKSKWYLFLFGLTKASTEMDLSDIRNRQHRQTPSSPILFPSFDKTSKDKEVLKASKKTSTRGKSLWKLLKVLCCKSKRANTVVQASVICVPRKDQLE